jgi:hypothetical protein
MAAGCGVGKGRVAGRSAPDPTLAAAWICPGTSQTSPTVMTTAEKQTIEELADFTVFI